MKKKRTVMISTILGIYLSLVFYISVNFRPLNQIYRLPLWTPCPKMHFPVFLTMSDAR